MRNFSFRWWKRVRHEEEDQEGEQDSSHTYPSWAAWFSMLYRLVVCFYFLISISISFFFLRDLLVQVSSTILLVSVLGSVSCFFRDKLSALVLHFFSLWIKKKGGSAGSGLYHERSICNGWKPDGAMSCGGESPRVVNFFSLREEQWQWQYPRNKHRLTALNL